jgi:2-polyprenyl-3-methyl-5-hydroxy-6-metoxy-1,4-benzoquinol methylase
MFKMNKLFEKLFYSFGINLSGYDVDLEIEYLKNNLPQGFKNRSVTDLGCGDGRVSLKLKQILAPKKFTGIDLYPSLVKSAKNKGLKAKVGDLTKDEIKGDLGILWGVVHHLQDPTPVLKKLNNNFNNLIIRESIDQSRVIEVGDKFNKESLMNIFNQAGVEIKKIVEIPQNKTIIVFI